MRGKFHPSNFITHNINLHANVTELKRTHALLLKLTKPHILHHFLTRLLARLLYFPQKNLFYARNLFDQTPITKDQFTWTSLIRSHVHHGHFRLSISLYTEMHRASVFPSGFTFSSLLTACACIPAISEGKQAHSMIEKLGFLANRIVKTALLDMYAKCGCLLEAEDVFITIDDKDIITWTAMIRGYAKMGMMSNARKLFDEMPQRNSVTWATMVSGYANCGEMREAKKLFDVMPERNMVSLVAVIAGYGKEGDVVEARKFFDGVEMERDVSCWAAMVACYAQNGYGKEAIDIYKKMKKEAVGMNEVAMVGAISACAQLGDFEMARVLAEDVEVKCCGKLF